MSSPSRKYAKIESVQIKKLIKAFHWSSQMKIATSCDLKPSKMSIDTKYSIDPSFSDPILLRSHFFQAPVFSDPSFFSDLSFFQSLLNFN